MEKTWDDRRLTKGKCLCFLERHVKYLEGIVGEGEAHLEKLRSKLPEGSGLPDWYRREAEGVDSFRKELEWALAGRRILEGMDEKSLRAEVTIGCGGREDSLDVWVVSDKIPLGVMYLEYGTDCDERENGVHLFVNGNVLELEA